MAFHVCFLVFVYTGFKWFRMVLNICVFTGFEWRMALRYTEITYIIEITFIIMGIQVG
jgi:hypothetical protein